MGYVSFQESAESLRAKVHLSDVNLPLLVGLTSLVMVVFLIAGYGLITSFSADSFAVEKAEEELVESTESQDNQIQEIEEDFVVIHVGGAVVSPGVYELTQGSRVKDALQAAGGFNDEASYEALNLARVVVDGEYIIVPTLEEVEAYGGTEGSFDTVDGAQTVADSKVNINTASLEELDTLPGIGPAIAQKIITDRESNGSFEQPEDLKRVSGIGDVTYAELANLICVA